MMAKMKKSIYQIMLSVVIVSAIPMAGFAEDSAQSMEIERLKDSIVRLQGDMNLMQKQFYQKSSSGGAALKGKPEVGAQFTDIEEKMRQLNGRVEELQFQVETLVKKNDSLTRDVYERLAAIENKIGQGAAASSAPATPPAAAAALPTATPVLPPATLPKTGDGTDVVLEKGPDGIKNVPSADQADDASTVTGAEAADGLAPAAQYQKAFGFVRQSKYVEAEAALQTFITENPKNPLVENAYYWLGETYYLRENYTQAAVQFMKGYQAYPKGNKSVDNLFKLALALDKLNKKKEACTTVQKLTTEFPKMAADMKAKVEKEKKRMSCGS